ncbi:MAG: DUF2339 domain-containing protein [Suipraeoptans sp.]
MDSTNRITKLEQDLDRLMKQRNEDQTEINRIHQELMVLKSDKTRTNENVQSSPNDMYTQKPQMNQPVNQQPMNRPPMNQQPVNQQSMNRPPVNQQPVNHQQMNQQPIPNYNTQNRQQGSMEGVFGKNVMGIVASLLIFIGLISFAVLIYDKIPDIAKSLLMFSVSIGIGAIGLFLSRKRSSTFSISLLGCGAGGLYISIIALHVVFDYVSDIAVYLLLLFWVLILTFLREKFIKHNMFRIICQLGVFISLMLVIGRQLSLIEYTLISIYAFVSCGIISFKRIKDNEVTILGDFITGLIIMTLMFLGGDLFFFVSSSKIVVSFNIILMLLYTLYLIRTYNKESSKNMVIYNVVLCFISIFYIVGVFGASERIFEEENLICLCLLTLFLLIPLLPGLLNKLRGDIEAVVFIPLILVLPFVWLTLIQSIGDNSANGIWILAVPLIILGYRNKKRIYKITSMILLFVSLLSLWSQTTVTFSDVTWVKAQIIVETIAVIICFGVVILFTLREQQNKRVMVFRIISHVGIIFAMCVIVDSFSFEMAYSIKLIIISLLLAIPLILGFYGKIIGSVAVTISTSFIYLFILAEISRVNELIVWNILFILIGLLYLFIDWRGLYHSYRKSSWLGWFIGIKATLLFSAALSNFVDTFRYSYILSVLFVLIACVCIFLGFKYTFKSLRVYGLVLTMLGVIKLVTLDISRLNSIIRVLALIVGGVLCFVISRLYNSASKRNDIENPNNQSDNNIDNNIGNQIW